MTDIMKLADDYAEKADAWNCGELNPQIVDKYRATMQSAIDALQAENERLKAEKAGLEHVKNAFELQMQTLQSQLDTMGKVEPVGFVAPHDLKTLREGYPATVVMLPSNKRTEPLYAAPKARTPLTDEQIYFGQWDDGSGSSADFREGARFAERHHGIGGTP